MKTFFTFFLFFIGVTTIIGQPGFSISLEFKFYENHKVVDLPALKSSYQLLDEHNKNIIADQADGIRETQDKKNCIFTGGVIYNDLIRKFVFNNDTMTLCLKNHLKRDRFQFVVDTLTFKKGKYLIAENHLSKLDFEKANQLYRETVLKEVVFGKFNGYQFFYKYSGSSGPATDHVTLYAETNGNKKLLTSIPLNDNYIDIAEMVIIQNQLFIYLNLNHISGDSDGKLYVLNLKTMTLSEVSIQKSTYKIPEGYTYRNAFGLVKDGNNLFSSVIGLRSEKEGKNYQAVTPYSLKKNGNQYELMPLETVLYETE